MAALSVSPFEKHYTPQELAELWHFSTSTVIRWFRDEPGVVVHSTPTRKKRSYETIRIPESVAGRVYREKMRVA